MAVAVNVFRTITETVGVTTTEIYTAPVGYTGVVLLAQVTNKGTDTQTISFGYRRNTGDTEIVKDLAIPTSDTANLLAGKLVLETDDVLKLSANSSTDIKLIGSILETLN